MLIKPKKLQKGDCIATISLSGGSAGESDMLWRYKLAKKRLEVDFGLNVIETKNSMKGRKYLFNNPKARAEDLMNAFRNPDIKAIFLNQGGDDAIRILPFIDFNVIKQNPKIFMGFSDATIIHFICYKAGLTSFNGPNVLTTLSEPIRLHDYTEKWIKKVLFDDSIIGIIEPAYNWTSEEIDWSKNESETNERKCNKNNGYELLQGNGKVHGRLIGGNIEPLTLMVKGSPIFPKMESWKNSIIFLEAVPFCTTPQLLIHMLRSLASKGIFKNANGLIFGKPMEHLFYKEFKKSILQVINEEEGLKDMPILYNLNFGHTVPLTVLPYGAMAEIDCNDLSFSILEAGVV